MESMEDRYPASRCGTGRSMDNAMAGRATFNRAHNDLANCSPLQRSFPFTLEAQSLQVSSMIVESVHRALDTLATALCGLDTRRCSFRPSGPSSTYAEQLLLARSREAYSLACVGTVSGFANAVMQNFRVADSGVGDRERCRRNARTTIVVRSLERKGRMSRGFSSE